MEPDRTRYAAIAGSWPPEVAQVAIEGITAIPAIIEIMELRRTRQGAFTLEPQVNDAEWLAFYDRPGYLSEAFETAFWVEPVGEALGIEPVNLVDRPDEEWPLEAFEEPRMLFMNYVGYPCLFVYLQNPSDLLDALTADDETSERAACRLARLDPRVVHHERVQQWMRRDERLTQFRAEKLKKWTRSETAFDAPKSNGHWVVVTLALISHMTETKGRRLLEPELRQLVEASSDWLSPESLEYVRERTNDDLARQVRRFRAKIGG